MSKTRESTTAAPKKVRLALSALLLIAVASCTTEGSRDSTEPAPTSEETLPESTTEGSPDTTRPPIHGNSGDAPAVPTTDDPTVAWDPEVDGRTVLTGFDQVLVTVTTPDGRSCELCMLHASIDAQRHRGLMFVTDPDLGGHDGMLFGYDVPRSGGFWMRNTRLPLTGVYIDGDGGVVDVVDMEPCSDDTPDSGCPIYDPAGEYVTMVELAARADETLMLEAGAVLEVVGGSCPEELARTD